MFSLFTDIEATIKYLLLFEFPYIFEETANSNITDSPTTTSRVRVGEKAYNAKFLTPFFVLNRVVFEVQENYERTKE